MTTPNQGAPKPRTGPRRPSRRGGNKDFGRLPHTGITVNDTLAAAGVGPDHHVMTVPLTDVAPNPDNPRDRYDDDQTREMAATFKDHGQLAAVTVVPRELWLTLYPHHAEAIGTASWVVALGNKRWYAAELAGLAEIRIEVSHQLNSIDAIEDAILIENVHREPLPPLREAEFLARRVKAYGSQRALAAKIHKTQGWISQRISLLHLADDLQGEITAGTLGIKDARWLAARSKKHTEQRDIWSVLRKLVPELQEAVRAGTLTIEDARPLAELEPDDQRQRWAAQREPAAAVSPPTPASDPRPPTAVPSPRQPKEAPEESGSDYPVITPRGDDDQAAERDVDQPAGADTAATTPDTSPRSTPAPAAPDGQAREADAPYTLPALIAFTLEEVADHIRGELDPAEVAQLAQLLAE